MARPKGKPDPARQAVLAGWALAAGHPVFAATRVPLSAAPEGELGAREHARLGPRGVRHHPTLRASAAEWAWVFAHLLLHQGFGHIRAAAAGAADLRRAPGGLAPTAEYRAACCAAVDRFLGTLKIGTPPVRPPDDLPAGEETALSERWRRQGIPTELTHDTPPDFVPLPDDHFRRWSPEDDFAAGLAAAADQALTAAGRRRTDGLQQPRGPWITPSHGSCRRSRCSARSPPA